MARENISDQEQKLIGSLKEDEELKDTVDLNNNRVAV